jgi:hypothetical protein
MAADTTNLFLLEDLEDSSRTTTLANSDLGALRAVADWIEGFVARPNADLGRPGPVCPFVPGAKDRKTLWLAPEEIADRGVSDVVSLMDDYKRLLLSAQPIEGDDANYKSILVVFTDLSADRARDYADDDQVQGLKRPYYAEDRLVLGEFYAGNEGSAIYNSDFMPFTPPTPFLLVRPAVVSDWKFFLDDDDWLNIWARHFGESAVLALAEELRRLPWNARRD